MKFFEYNLWMDTRSADENIRQAALKIWAERARLYAEDYSKAKEYLTKTFIMSYEANFGFRGCYFTDLLLTPGSKKENAAFVKRDIFTCKLLLSDLIDSWQLTYSNLEFVDYQPAVKEIPWVTPAGYPALEFSELLPYRQDKLSHELLLSDGSTLLICFSGVSVKKINKP